MNIFARIGNAIQDETERAANGLTAAGFVHSRYIYPQTLEYIGGVAVLAATAAGWLPLLGGIFILGFGAVLAVLGQMRSDDIDARAGIEQVHHLVNSQHDALLDRIDVLEAALINSGTTVPPEANHPARPAVEGKRQ